MLLSATVDHEDAVRRARQWSAALLRTHLPPPPELSVSEWADTHRVLPETAAEPGRWRTSRTPYLRELMDAFGDPLVERVVFMKAAQIGGSEMLLNVLGFFVDQDPAPILLVQVSDGEAAKFSKERVAPMLTDSPVLAAKVAPPRSRQGGNTIESKDFPGGHLGIVGANAPSKLRARPRRVVLFDEIDGYPPSAGTEGDPIELGVKRTSTFWNRKIGMISTPTVKGASRVENAFLESDQRYYLVPCPHCDTEQALVWERVKWASATADGVKVARPDTAAYECAGCERLIDESHKPRMLAAGRWEARTESSIRGYHMNALYSPWYTWAELAREFLAAKGHRHKLRVFVNTRLAETFEERGEAPPWRRLYERREHYPLGTCPAGVEFLTAGADVQDNRVEVFVWGWGAGSESWLIDHQIVPGDPFDPATWPEVTKVLHATYPAAEGGGSLPIARFAIDTGYAQETVIGWARRVADRRIMLVKGDHWKNWKVIVGSPSRSDVTWRGRKTGLQLWPVGGAVIKQETYGFLRLDAPLDGESYPPGYVHLPQVDEEVVQQLVAEDLVTRSDKKGFAVREWVKNRTRNEALDCRVYARAAAEQMGLSRMEPQSVDPQMLQEQIDALRIAEEQQSEGQPRRQGGGWLDTNRRRGGWL